MSATTGTRLRRGDTSDRKECEERDGERGERIPLQRVALVPLDAEVRARPVAQQTIVQFRMLLDDDALQAQAGLGGESAEVEVLADFAARGGACLECLLQALERHAF